MEDRQSLLGEIRRLAGSPANDAVRLAFLAPEEMDQLDQLDLSAVTEFKRNSNGTVELKFVDRLEALQWLLEKNAEDPKAERLYGALEQNAERLPEQKTEQG